MSIPEPLTPTTTEALLLPSSATVRILKTTPTFRGWHSPVPFDRYGNKTVLDYRGEPLFAELVILRLFEAAGWSGVWIDTYRKCFRKDASGHAEIPAGKLRVLERIFKISGSKSGCFDVFVWKDDALMFAESKRARRDHLRVSQRRWLNAALDLGLPADAFLVVEWATEEVPNKALQR